LDKAVKTAKNRKSRRERQRRKKKDAAQLKNTRSIAKESAKANIEVLAAVGGLDVNAVAALTKASELRIDAAAAEDSSSSSDSDSSSSSTSSSRGKKKKHKRERKAAKTASKATKEAAKAMTTAAADLRTILTRTGPGDMGVTPQAKATDASVLTPETKSALKLMARTVRVRERRRRGEEQEAAQSAEAHPVRAVVIVLV
jgi:hypothetical protein